MDEWPAVRPLAAELYPGLLGIGLELWDGDEPIGVMEDLDLYVNDDPTGSLSDIEGASNGFLQVVGVLNDRVNGREICVWEASIDTAGHVAASRDLIVRRGYGIASSLSAVLEQYPPTIYFLDGTTTIGPLRYDSRTLTSAFNPQTLRTIDWSGVDITAETPRTAASHGAGASSVHDRLAEYLRTRPRLGSARWILYNDGPGEIADYLVVEELSSGELHLGLWHAKASSSGTPSVRIKDFQELVAQALRSRRQFPSATLWRELGERVAGVAHPRAVVLEGSDDQRSLERRLGLVGDNDVDVPWTRSFPVVRGTLGIVQPGLSLAKFRDAIGADPMPASAKSLRELFSVLSDMAQSDGVELEIVVSP